MNRQEITQRRKEIQAAIENSNRERDHWLSTLRILQKYCSHPKQRRISTMGELCDYCPDCEWQS